MFGLGGLQTLLTTVVISFGALWFGQPAAAALIIGACLALSSTALVMEVLSGQRRMMSTTGRSSFAILLAQDLAVVPLLFLIGRWAEPPTATSVAQGVVIALVEAAVAIAVIAVVGRLVLKPLFKLAAGTDNPEFFMAATLLIAVGSGVIAAYAGLSMALGAFVAGLLLAETEYRRAVEAMIDPFRGLLLGVFFFSVGMHIDLGFIWREPLLVLGGFLAMMAIKSVLLVPLCRLFGVPLGASVETGLLLAPGGEFAFIGIGLAVQVGLVAADVSAGILAVVSLSMATLPFIALFARRAGLICPRNVVRSPFHRATARGPCQARHRRRPRPGRPARLRAPGGARHRLYRRRPRHRAGRALAQARPADLLRRCLQSLFLQRCGIDEATGVIVTLDTSAVDDVVRAVRARRPDVMIVARAHDAQHARHLYAQGHRYGARDHRGEPAARRIGAGWPGVPMGLVIASIHERRETVRRELQAAAGTTSSITEQIREARRDRVSKS